MPIIRLHVLCGLRRPSVLFRCSQHRLSQDHLDIFSLKSWCQQIDFYPCHRTYVRQSTVRAVCTRTGETFGSVSIRYAANNLPSIWTVGTSKSCSIFIPSQNTPSPRFTLHLPIESITNATDGPSSWIIPPWFVVMVIIHMEAATQLLKYLHVASFCSLPFLWPFSLQGMDV